MMDNFDHIEDTKSGKGSSHDTILMAFQNQNENNEEHVSTPIKQDIEKNKNDRLKRCSNVKRSSLFVNLAGLI